MVGVGLLCIVLCMMSHALFYPAHLLSYCFGLAIAFQIILFSPNLALCMVRAGNFVERGDNVDIQSLCFSMSLGGSVYVRLLRSGAWFHQQTSLI